MTSVSLQDFRIHTFSFRFTPKAQNKHVNILNLLLSPPPPNRIAPDGMRHLGIDQNLSSIQAPFVPLFSYK